jgi:hypothetical protein
LRRDPEWCAFVCYAALVMNAGRANDVLARAVGAVKHGDAGLKRLTARSHIEDLTLIVRWNRLRVWLWCIRDASRDGRSMRPCLAAVAGAS